MATRTVTREDLYTRVFDGLFRHWHWFSYHFDRKLRGEPEPFAEAIIDACLDVEASLPGFSYRTLDRLVELGGIENHEPHYEQLMQLLAEVHVIRQLVRHTWPQTPSFTLEPVAPSSAKNPEVSVELGSELHGVEVKSPQLLEYGRKRGQLPAQFPARSEHFDQFAAAAGGKDQVLLPRDNPVKDFLLSADEKFAGFKTQDPKFNSALVIVWDDFIQEPLTSLVHPQAGLFTPNSFAIDSNGAPFQFANVDGVVLVRHLHQLRRAAAEKPLVDGFSGPLDYGGADNFPPKVYVPNPHAGGLSPPLLDALQGHLWHGLNGAEHSGDTDGIFWLDA
jgi:hypothetical protein